MSLKWKKSLFGLLLHTSSFLFNLGTALGLTTFYYSKRHKSFVDSKFLHRYSKLMALAFFFTYPLAVGWLIPGIYSEKTSITDLIRNSAFIGNWVICTILILTNQTAHSSKCCNLYNQAVTLYMEIARNECKPNRDSNCMLSLFAKCFMKTVILAVGFSIVNIIKFSYNFDKPFSIFGVLMLFFLYIPSFIMILVSNKFYAATTFCLFLIMRINNGISALSDGCRGVAAMGKTSTTATKVSEAARNYAKLHQLFVDFNSLFSKHILLILGFCFMNVLFEVSCAEVEITL